MAARLLQEFVQFRGINKFPILDCFRIYFKTFRLNAIISPVKQLIAQSGKWALRSRLEANFSQPHAIGGPLEDFHEMSRAINTCRRCVIIPKDKLWRTTSCAVLLPAPPQRVFAYFSSRYMHSWSFIGKSYLFSRNVRNVLRGRCA